jgi:hypothetical protein
MAPSVKRLNYMLKNVSAEAKAKAKKDDTYFGLSKSNQ